MPFPKVKLPFLGNIKFGGSATSSQTTVHEAKALSPKVYQVQQTEEFSAVPILDPTSQNNHDRLVQWGVHWHKYPLLIFLVFSIGTGAALGHHYFYLSLEGKMPVNDLQKQTVLLVGNILSFLAIFLWRMSVTMSYRQYIWITIKKKSLKLSTIDKIFALTSDPRGFFSWEVITKTKVLFLMGLIAWGTPLGGIGLSSTMILKSQPANYAPRSISMPSFDWKEGNWFPSRINPVTPTPEVLNIATRVATNMEVLPLQAYGFNSSYIINLSGPYVQCAETNSTQQAVLSKYQRTLATRHNVATASTFNEIESSKRFLFSAKENVWSAFDPTLGGPNSWVGTYFERFGDNEWEPDKFNNWGVNIPSNSTGYYVEGLSQSNLTAYLVSLDKDPDEYTEWLKLFDQRVPRQLWVLTSNSSLVCTLGNATREVNIRSVNGTQQISYGELRDFKPIFVPRLGNQPKSDLQPTTEEYAYVAVWQAMLNMLSGNVTTAHDIDEDARIHSSNSNILLTGLTACKEFTNNYWVDHWYTSYRNVVINKNGPPTGNSSIPATSKFQTSVFGSQNPERCRNGTLARAIEDLTTNITISLMTAGELLTTSNPILIPVTITTNELRFAYDALTVLIAYVSTGLFAFICVILGFYALIKNGITHNNNFSGMVSVSRNTELDELFRGHGTGAKPLGKPLEGLRMRMGVVSQEHGGEEEGVGHVAFGGEEGVVVMRRGGRYY